MLTRTELITVDSIAQDKLGKECQKGYNWAFRLLDTLRNRCREDCSNGTVVWRVLVRPSAAGDTVIRQLSHEELDIVNRGERRTGILPLWFVDGLGPEQ